MPTDDFDMTQEARARLETADTWAGAQLEIDDERPQTSLAGSGRMLRDVGLTCVLAAVVCGGVLAALSVTSTEEPEPEPVTDAGEIVETSSVSESAAPTPRALPAAPSRLDIGEIHAATNPPLPVPPARWIGSMAEPRAAEPPSRVVVPAKVDRPIADEQDVEPAITSSTSSTSSSGLGGLPSPDDIDTPVHIPVTEDAEQERTEATQTAAEVVDDPPVDPIADMVTDASTPLEEPSVDVDEVVGGTALDIGA